MNGYNTLQTIQHIKSIGFQFVSSYVFKKGVHFVFRKLGVYLLKAVKTELIAISDDEEDELPRIKKPKIYENE